MSPPTIEQAIALLQQGQVESAAQLLVQIVQRSPQDAVAHAALGHCQIRLGREQDAWRSLTTACGLSDRIGQAFSDLAWLAIERDDIGVALPSAEKAIALNGGDANAHFARARALFRQQRFGEAEQAFARAGQINARFLDGRQNLGNQAFDRGDFDSASRHYGAYTQSQPQDVHGWINFGLSLARINELARARVALERAVTLAPTMPKPAALLATVLRSSNVDDAELIPVLRRAVELSPDGSALHLQLACSLFNEQAFAEARRHLQAVRRLDPDNLTARWLEFQMQSDVVVADEAARDEFFERWKAGIAYFENLDLAAQKYAIQAGDVIASAANFYLAYLGRPLVEEQRRNARVLRRLAVAAGWTGHEPAARPIGARRRKLAVFTSSLNAHSVSLVWSSALLALDPAEFEIGAFYPDTVEDASTKRWRDRAEHFESGARSVENWIASLRAFAPDILIFPDIGMNRLVQAVASVRHAPVQVATWGHPVTTGMSTIDYFLSADACEPENASTHYSERLVRLPRLGSYLDLPDPIRLPQRSNTEFRFLCSQSADKLHPAHDALFARILRAAPGARLDILCSKPAHIASSLERRMRQEFAQHDLDFDARCAVHPRQPTQQYHRFLAEADACLDSLDFSGCITSLDALWRDLPIVTLPGELMRGRQTFGMLRLLGLNELIASDIDDYVHVASRLAQDEPWRRSVAMKIASRKVELYRDRTVVDALAAFLRSVEPPA